VSDLPALAPSFGHARAKASWMCNRRMRQVDAVVELLRATFELMIASKWCVRSDLQCSTALAVLRLRTRLV
jgi:hypothetical protein